MMVNCSQEHKIKQDPHECREFVRKSRQRFWHKPALIKTEGT